MAQSAKDSVVWSNVLSYVISVFGISGYFLITRGHHVLGHAILFVDQFLWVTFAISIHKYGLLMTCPLYAWVAIQGLTEAKRSRTVCVVDERNNLDVTPLGNQCAS